MAFAENNFMVANRKQLDKKQLEVECNVNCEREIRKVLTVSCSPAVEWGY